MHLQPVPLHSDVEQEHAKVLMTERVNEIQMVFQMEDLTHTFHSSIAHIYSSISTKVSLSDIAFELIF